jgi:hypothetical protein
MSWNTDMSQAPRGKTAHRLRVVDDKDITVETFVPDHVILATKCGKVTRSYWIPDEQRWCMLAKGEEPIAWQDWPEWPTPSLNHTGEAA